MGRIAWAVALVISVSIAAAAPAAADGPLTVGSITAAPGEKKTGVIEVPAGSDAGTSIPITVVNGAQPGPVLALFAGTHGYEYTSIMALPKVAAQLDPAKMKGAVILVHMVSPVTFYGRLVYRGPDGKNQNRVYPGDKAGTISDRIAERLTVEVIDKATHVVDMHCGDGNESLRPYSYWAIIGDPKLDEATRQMNIAFGLPYIVVTRDRTKDPAKSLYTDNTALMRGKPAMTAESGGMGLTDEQSVAAQVKGALSVAAHLGIQAGPSARTGKPVWIDKSEIVTAPATGVFVAAVAKAKPVAAGAVLGRIYDPYGALLAEVKAPFAGEVLYVIGTPPMSKGEPVAYIGEVSATEPKP
jgi:predicted deacylase